MDEETFGKLAVQVSNGAKLSDLPDIEVNSPMLITLAGINLSVSKLCVLIKLAMYGKLELLQELLAGVNLEISNEYGWGPIEIAVQYSQMNVVRYFAKNAHLHLNHSTIYGWTPLM